LVAVKNHLNLCMMATSLIAQDALDKDFQLVWPFRRKLIENSFAAAFMRIAACNFVGNLRSEKQGKNCVSDIP